jgi:hypothetical protein
MCVRSATLLLGLLICSAGLSQQQPSSNYIQKAVVQHSGRSATVMANDPRPLNQAIAAIRAEYGWVVDYEESPYRGDSSDTITLKPPSLQVARQGSGLLIPGGGAFQSTYPEGPEVFDSPSIAEPQILGKIVSDYNQSSNPGNFTVRELGDGTYTVVGTAVRNSTGRLQLVNPILDTLISLPTGTRAVRVTLALIADALTAKSGVKVKAYGLDGNLPPALRLEVTVGGDNVSTRDLLMATADGIRMKTYWVLLYNPTGQLYTLTILPVPRDQFGQKSILPPAQQ